jgi:hypothetical protein
MLLLSRDKSMEVLRRDVYSDPPLPPGGKLPRPSWARRTTRSPVVEAKRSSLSRFLGMGKGEESAKLLYDECCCRGGITGSSSGKPRSSDEEDANDGGGR